MGYEPFYSILDIPDLFRSEFIAMVRVNFDFKNPIIEQYENFIRAMPDKNLFTVNMILVCLSTEYAYKWRRDERTHLANAKLSEWITKTISALRKPY